MNLEDYIKRCGEIFFSPALQKKSFTKQTSLWHCQMNFLLLIDCRGVGKAPIFLSPVILLTSCIPKLTEYDTAPLQWDLSVHYVFKSNDSKTITSKKPQWHCIRSLVPQHCTLVSHFSLAQMGSCVGLRETKSVPWPGWRGDPYHLDNKPSYNPSPCILSEKEAAS